MDILLSIIAFLLGLLGLVGCIVPVIPGALLSYMGVLCAFFTSYSQLGSGTLWVWALVCILVTLADYFLPAWMTKRFGGTRSGAIGATIGVFVGFFLFPPFGVILGPFMGAVLGELLHDKSDAGKAVVVGFGSFLAFIFGTGLKLVASVGIFVHIVADTWPAIRTWFTTLFA